MILIKHIEFIQVDRDPYQMISCSAPYEAVEVLSDKGDVVVPINEVAELIKGRRFVRPSDNVDITIGLSKQAEDVLGIQYEAWDELQKRADDYWNNFIAIRERIEAVQKMSFWERFKGVFSGFSDA